MKIGVLERCEWERASRTVASLASRASEGQAMPSLDAAVEVQIHIQERDLLGRGDQAVD